MVDPISDAPTLPMSLLTDSLIKGILPAENILFIIRFYAIMHRTTIVQNKIISIICSFFFFCPANIYGASLRKVRLGRPNPNLSQSLNIYLRRKKKHSTQNCMHYNVSPSDFQFSFSFFLNYF